MVRVRSPFLPVALPVLALVLVACGQSPGPSSSPVATTSPAASGSDGPTPADGSGDPGRSAAGAGNPVWLPEWAEEASVPEAVAGRAPLRFCGLEQAPQPAPGEFVDAVVRACFWDVWQAGGAAEFASVQSTMEGDPIATVYRLPGDGTVEVLSDGSQDRFGSGGWTLTRCRSLVEDTEGSAFFGVADCDEGELLE